jgi:basic amino acid/polyamine antiporter, APA family
MTFGQTRIFFAMSRDGLLPKVFGAVHPKYGTPVKSTLLVGTVCALLAGFTPIGVVAELCNIGTLAAFIIVSASIIYMRKRRPDLKRSFRCPWVPFIPLLAIAFNLYLIVVLPTVTHIRFVVWLALGIIVYYFYGRKHSTMNK